MSALCRVSWCQWSRCRARLPVDDHASHAVFSNCGLTVSCTASFSTVLPTLRLATLLPLLLCTMSLLTMLFCSFGGRRGLYGLLDRLATGPIADRATSPYMVGFGTTPEAIEAIPIVFDLVWEMYWRSQPFDVGQWVQAYASRRYGGYSSSLSQAAAILYPAAYSADIDETPLENAPCFTCFSSRNTNATGILAALRLFVAAAENKEVDPSLGPYSYDLTDLARQALLNIWDDVHTFQGLAYQPFVTFGANTTADVAPLTAMMGAIVGDLDAVLAGDANFLLGPWIADARAMASSASSPNASAAEADGFELNARNIITLWGPGDASGGNSINDYAARHWSGVVGPYYGQRWALQGQYILQSLRTGVHANWSAYAAQHLAIEQGFSADRTPQPTTPTGDPVALAAAALARWASYNATGPQSEFVVFPNTDEDGDAIYQTWNGDAGVFLGICAAAQACASVNSNGYLKPSAAYHVPFPGASLYVKASQLVNVKRAVSAPIYPPHLEATVRASGVLDRIASASEVEKLSAAKAGQARAARDAGAGAHQAGHDFSSDDAALLSMPPLMRAAFESLDSAGTVPDLRSLRQAYRSWSLADTMPPLGQGAFSEGSTACSATARLQRHPMYRIHPFTEVSL